MRIAAIALLLLAPFARAEIVAKDVEYQDHLGAKVKLQGYLAYDDAVQGKRPGVLIVHQWTGITDHEKNVAKELAKLGYVAFCVDVYGKGIRPKAPQDAGAQAGKFRTDRKLFRHRMILGMGELVKTKLVANRKIAAIATPAASPITGAQAPSSVSVRPNPMPRNSATWVIPSVTWSKT